MQLMASESLEFGLKATQSLCQRAVVRGEKEGWMKARVDAIESVQMSVI